MTRFEFESKTFMWFCPTFMVVWRIMFACLVCVGDRFGMACSDEDRCKNRTLDAEDHDGHTGRVLGGQAIEQSDGAVCGLHHAHGDEKREFLG
jgi:hypothetical protein